MRPLPRNGDVLRKAVIDSKQSMEGQIRLASQWNPCNTRSLAMKALTTEYTVVSAFPPLVCSGALHMPQVRKHAASVMLSSALCNFVLGYAIHCMSR